MTYYVNFPDGKIRSPEDLTATVLVTNENESPRDLGGVPISWAPGGNVIKLTLMNLPVRDFITLKVRSIKEQNMDECVCDAD
jgi:hypothetical protein